MKEFKFKINGTEYNAAVEELEGQKATVTLNGKAYEVELEEEQAAAPVARPAAAPAAAAAPQKAAGAAVTVKSPLPGSIVKVLVKEGQDVKKGDVLLTMESMKMENQVAAECDGKVLSISVQPGQNVMQDDVLLQLQGAGAPAAAPAAPVAPKAAPAPKAAAAPAPKAAAPAAGAKVVKSPLPGSIVKIKVAEGAAIKKGDTLLTMESMKMENEIKAEQDGTCGTIFVKEGQNVMQDDNLLEIK